MQGYLRGSSFSGHRSILGEHLSLLQCKQNSASGIHSSESTRHLAKDLRRMAKILHHLRPTHPYTSPETTAVSLPSRFFNLRLSVHGRIALSSDHPFFHRRQDQSRSTPHSSCQCQSGEARGDSLIRAIICGRIESPNPSFQCSSCFHCMSDRDDTRLFSLERLSRQLRTALPTPMFPFAIIAHITNPSPLLPKFNFYPLITSKGWSSSWELCFASSPAMQPDSQACSARHPAGPTCSGPSHLWTLVPAGPPSEPRGRCASCPFVRTRRRIGHRLRRGRLRRGDWGRWKANDQYLLKCGIAWYHRSW